jgi:ATP-dependent protease Clp ATPase subunit
VRWRVHRAREDHLGAQPAGSIGFGAEVMAPEDRKQGEIFRDVEPEDLLKYGLIIAIYRAIFNIVRTKADRRSNRHLKQGRD